MTPSATVGATPRQADVVIAESPYVTPTALPFKIFLAAVSGPVSGGDTNGNAFTDTNGANANGYPYTYGEPYIYSIANTHGVTGCDSNSDADGVDTRWQLPNGLRPDQQ